MPAIILQPLLACLGLGTIAALIVFVLVRFSKATASLGGRKHLVAMLLLGGLSTAALSFFTSSGQPGRLFKGVHAGYPEMYSLLTESYAAGHLDILIQPSPQLLALSNPYDPKANEGLRLHDAILYQGKYYLYYSPVPVYLLAIPVWKLTGAHVSQAAAVALFASIGVWASLAALWRIRQAWYAQSPVWLLGSLALGLAFMPSLMHLSGRPAVYEEAVAASYCFLMLGAWSLVVSLTNKITPMRWALVSSICFSFAIGCRPNLTLTCPFLGVAWLYLAVRSGQPVCGQEERVWNLFSFRTWFAPAVLLRFFVLCMPFVMIGALLAGLNWARFGSPLEFGWRWQLWGWKKPAYEAVFFSWQNIAPDFQLYFVTPLKTLDHFPYVAATTFRSLCRSPFTTGAEPLLGLMWSMPLLLISSLWWMVRGGLPSIRVCSAGQLWFFAIGGSGFVAMVFNLFYSSVAMRYQMDFAPLLQLAGCAAVFHFASTTPTWRRPWLAALVCAFAVAMAAIALALGLTSYDNFQNQNPELFAALKSRL